MRRFLQKVLSGPVLRLANKFSSKPDKKKIHHALTKLYSSLKFKPGKKGPVISINAASPEKFIIFSDLHKGNKKRADDFKVSEKSYLDALRFYSENGYTLIHLGDVEELWKFNLFTVKGHNTDSISLEREFVNRDALIKVYGNHDLFWKNDPFAPLQLLNFYNKDISTYEAVLLQYDTGEKVIDIFLTHGHQGDGLSDGNKFAAWFVAKIWAPLQSYLELSINTPAFNDILKTEHNQIMYEWGSLHPDLLVITGHTHQPVFESMTHLERLYKQLLIARQQNDETSISKLQEEIAFRRQEYKHISEDYLHLKPVYFNTGCCCFNDGDITGIEIEHGEIRLIKWKSSKEVPAQRMVLEHADLNRLCPMET
ncbi:MAG: metallophosphoesterase family protein [Chitinophagaceae bacterium]|nr:metallophosphoesterase family protein [Chitinophagaceae bacterium]MCW5926432.1 metallophosphoesterase family protein [Chitinophagaceae bacterium]